MIRPKHLEVPGLKQYAIVRVRQLIRPVEVHDNWKLNRRPPLIGDIGTIVDILRAPGAPDNYVVECSGPDGVTEWLGDFSVDEIEPAEEK